MSFNKYTREMLKVICKYQIVLPNGSNLWCHMVVNIVERLIG